MKKLNSTGSLWVNKDGYAFSYNTQLTGTYKGLKVFNNTYYSTTTRKHQSYFRGDKFDLILEYCRFGTKLQPDEVEKAIKDELEILDDELLDLFKKRNTNKKQELIKNINNRKAELITVLSK